MGWLSWERIREERTGEVSSWCSNWIVVGERIEEERLEWVG